MRNFEKYQTAEERSKAFDSFCHGAHCGLCPANVAMNECEFVWLELEAETEEDANKK